MSKSVKVTHLTSVHPRYDARIFVKECCSLAKAGYDVTLVVADGLGDEMKNGVRILDVGKHRSRMKRIIKATKAVFEKAKALDCDLYHFHDPELLWVGWRLKKTGRSVVFDAHEDVPRQILAKTYIPTWLRKSASWIVEHFENFIVRRLDAVVAPTPLIAERFRAVGTQAVEVRNFPIYEEVGNRTPWDQREDSVCYIGAISRTRGIEEMVRAMEYCPVQFELGGDFRPASLQQEIEELSGWEQIRHHGFVNRTQVQAILAKSKIGLVTLHPTDSYLEAIPVKMFEYMAAGIPFIASDFPFWRRILEGYECGLFVDPLDPKTIGDAICRLMDDQKLARQMGQNGIEAVKATFRWEHESAKLQQLYATFLKENP
jgi:glycosyltransferase involved in cell wall biosynthesis